MNGLRPAAVQIFNQVVAAPVHIPRDVGRLISEYAEPDFSLAEQPFRRNSRNEISLKKNLDIWAAIKLALESPFCDPSVKVKIFENSRGEYDYSAFYLNSILRSIRDAGGRIILDNCHFEGLQLRALDLSGASIVAAKFIGVTMQTMSLNQVDLSGACIVDTVIKLSDLCEASLYKSVLKNCTISISDLTSADLRKAGFDSVTFQGAIMNRCDTDDPQLWKNITASRTSMIAARLSNVPRESLNYEQSRLIDYAIKKNTNSIYNLSCKFSSECGLVNDSKGTQRKRPGMPAPAL